MSTNQIDENSYEDVANEIQNYLGMLFLLLQDNPFRAIHLKCATLSTVQCLIRLLP